MTIEITDEMRAAFRAEREDWCDEVGCSRDDCLTDRLAAVLAIVERDHDRLRALCSSLVAEVNRLSADLASARANQEDEGAPPRVAPKTFRVVP